MILRFRRKRIPEANIQAEFYRQCKNNGINVCLEYRFSGCRFDAVVYDQNKFIHFIVEVKSYTDPNKKPNWNTKQIKKYKQFRTPVLLIVRMEGIKEAIEHIKKEMNL